MSDRRIQIENISSGPVVILEGIYCKSFFCRLKGLMFQKSITRDFGLLLAENSESKINSAIHMFFMNFDIAVVWMDKNFCVVDVTIAKKGRPFYAPKRPAQYTLEIAKENWDQFHSGDQIKVTYVD